MFDGNVLKYSTLNIIGEILVPKFLPVLSTELILRKMAVDRAITVNDTSELAVYRDNTAFDGQQVSCMCGIWLARSTAQVGSMTPMNIVRGRLFEINNVVS